MTILLRQKPLTQVVRQIVQRDNGAWFDPEDMSTMYQDAVGNTPVIALEQPVGLWLDKSQGLELGPELVPDPTFSQWTDPTVPDGWVKTNTHNSTNYVRQAEGGGIRVVSDGSLMSISKANTLTIGKVYKVTFIATNAVNPSVSTPIDALEVARISAVGTSTFVQVAGTGNTLQLKRYAPDGSTDMVISYFSVREIKGNHAIQSITASRPTLSARYNLLTKTEDFADAVWQGSANSGVQANVLNSPISTMTVDKVTFSDATYGYKRSSITVTPNTQYTFSYWLETTASSLGAEIRVYDATNSANISITPCVYSAGFIRQQVTFTTPSNCTTVYVYSVSSNSAIIGRSYYLWGHNSTLAQLHSHTSESTPQRITTA